MYSEYEMRADSIDRRLVLMLSVGIFTAIFVTMCIFSTILLSQREEPRPPVVQQAIPAVLPLTGPPVNYYSTYLPVALSAPVPQPANIWKVMKIDTLGYELQGQLYDLATFTRSDGLVTLQGYCINRGWDVPAVGTEYLLTAEDIFVPLQEPEGDPFQRFLRFN